MNKYKPHSEKDGNVMKIEAEKTVDSHAGRGLRARRDRETSVATSNMQLGACNAAHPAHPAQHAVKFCMLCASLAFWGRCTSSDMLVGTVPIVSVLLGIVLSQLHGHSMLKWVETG
jgi:hypothetical protein